MSDITDDQINLFSRRKEQVDDALESQGRTRAASSAAQRDAANMATRESKSQLSQIDQAWEWRSRLREAGVGIDKMIRAARDVLKRGPSQSPIFPRMPLHPLPVIWVSVNPYSLNV